MSVLYPDDDKHDDDDDDDGHIAHINGTSKSSDTKWKTQDKTIMGRKP